MILSRYTTAQADQDRRDREKRLKAEARNPPARVINRKDPVEQIQDGRSAVDGKRAEEIKRAEELKRKAEADLAAVAEARAKLAAEAAKQSEIKSTNKRANDDVEAAKTEQLRIELKSSESKERIEAALLGALEPDDSAGETQIKQQSSDDSTLSKRPDKAKTLQRKSRLPQYDVIFMKDKKDEIDVPQLLEGSLKDLLKEGSPTRRSSSGDLNY